MRHSASFCAALGRATALTEGYSPATSNRIVCVSAPLAEVTPDGNVRRMTTAAGREGMSKEVISVRIPSEKKAALDAIAARIDRDVSFVIEEAVNAYLDLHAWQREDIEEGVRQADAGEVPPEAEVGEAFARWRR